jgi:hypothetical protein
MASYPVFGARSFRSVMAELLENAPEDGLCTIAEVLADMLEDIRSSVRSREWIERNVFVYANGLLQVVVDALGSREALMPHALSFSRAFPHGRGVYDVVTEFTGWPTVSTWDNTWQMMQFCTQKLDELAKHHAPSLLFANTRRTAPLIK